MMDDALANPGGEQRDVVQQSIETIAHQHPVGLAIEVISLASAPTAALRISCVKAAISPGAGVSLGTTNR